MTRRVVFVDDEPNVLAGMRRSFRALGREWDLRFVGSGAAALALMGAEPVDALVTDMRMPDMPGDELLARVRRAHPRAVRVALTGQCTRDAMLRLVPLAHRVFTKPCDTEELKAAIRSACGLQEVFHGPALLALVGGLGSLPTPPALYTRLLAELERPDGSVAAVGRIVAQDVGLSAKLIQLANSSVLGFRRAIVDPAQAVQALGFETTKAVFLVSEVVCRYDPAALRPFSIDALWPHSLEVAALAERIGRTEAGAGAGADARLAGLLHDVGRLVLATQQPETYKRVLAGAAAGAALTEAERQEYGVTHAEVGAYLLGLWGLPGPLVEAVAWHHTPARSAAPRFDALAAVHAAEGLLAPDEGGPPESDYLARLGAGRRPAEWADWRNRPERTE